jgi:N-acetyltransferase
MGVHQLWTHKSHRQKHIARTLVDAARGKLIFGMTVPHNLVAFSSPTVDGALFAKKYSFPDAPLVYDF